MKKDGGLTAVLFILLVALLPPVLPLHKENLFRIINLS